MIRSVVLAYKNIPSDSIQFYSKYISSDVDIVVI